MIGLIVTLLLLVPAVLVIRYAVGQSTRDQAEKQAQKQVEVVRSPAHPSRSQKGDPDGYSWPWELTASEGPDDDA